MCCRPCAARWPQSRLTSRCPTLGYLNVGLLALRPLLPRRIWLVVCEANMPLSGTDGHVRRLLGTGMRLLYRRADLVLSPAVRVADGLVANYRIQPSRVCVSPNPVDIGRVRKLAEPPRRLAGPILQLGASGRSAEQKGYRRLVTLLPGLPTNTPLTNLGEGPLRETLTAQIAAAGLGSRVALPGFASAPCADYVAADAFLMPSLWEGLPNAALGALADGNPVIATPEAGGNIDVAAAAAPGAVALAAVREPMRGDRAGPARRWATACKPAACSIRDRDGGRARYQ